MVQIAPVVLVVQQPGFQDYWHALCSRRCPHSLHCPCFPAIVAPPTAVEGRWAAEVGPGAALDS